MKKRIIVFISVFISHVHLYGQWEVINEGLGGWVTEIDFVNNDVGWIAGTAFYKTSDGGETWHPLPLFERFDLARIDFVNENNGWAIIGNRILKSDDSGQNWHVQKTLPDNISLRILEAVNDSVAYVSGYVWIDGNRLYILKTVDGGSNWIDISPYSADIGLNSSAFPDNNVGVVSGYIDDSVQTKSAVLITLDGGVTWDMKIIAEFEGIYDPLFLNDSTICFLARNNNEYFLCKTTDMFNSWIIIYQSKYRITSYSAFDSTIMLIVSDSSYYSSYYYVMKSTDGGSIWQKIKSEYNASKIFFSSKEKGFLINGAPIKIWKSNDGGDTWVKNIFSYPLSGVTFVNEETGFACCSYCIGLHCEPTGVVFKTTDAGKTWETKQYLFGFVTKIFFINEQTGFSLFDDGQIYKTRDSGNTWFLVYEDNIDSTGYDFFWGSDLTFTDEKKGWAVGSAYWGNDTEGGAVLATVDGGENWRLIWKLDNTGVIDYHINSIFAISNMVWAVGESGLIIRSSQPDSFTVQNANTDLPLYNVFFSNENNGWITGGYQSGQFIQSILLKTTDAGQTWTERRFDSYRFNDMYFADSLHGWVVGNDTSGAGMILESFDGGVNWNAVVENLSGPLNAMHFKNGIGWAVGDNGLVLRTDGTTWVNQNTGEKYPAKCTLGQNHPNPFNNSTIISYQLPKNSVVKLTVHDILGQKVATLVNRKQAAGSYKVKWDATGFASGVYLYRLMTDAGYVISRKLVVLK